MGTAVGERYWDVYYSYSTDHGATWAKNLRLTSPSIDAKHGATFNNIDTRGPIGVASTDHAAYVAWADSRATVDQNEADDAYLSRIRFVHVGELGATTTTSGGTELSWAIAGAGVALAVGGVLFFMMMARGRSGSASPVPKQAAAKGRSGV